MMTPERVMEHATNLARRLGDVRSEEWSVLGTDPPEHVNPGVFIGQGNARLHVGVSQGRWTVRGEGPDGYRLPTDWRASFALEPDGRWPAWDSLRIAREVNRRILAAGYADELLVVLYRKGEDERELAERMRWLSQVAGMFGVGIPSGFGTDGRKVFLRQFVKGSGYVESYLPDETHLSISLSGIPAEVALAMLAPLAEHVAARCQCCFTYGPDHPPQFSVVGCLYRDSAVERGEVASRARVFRFLDKSRGIGHAEIHRALDAARQHGAEVIDPDGEVLAVITWDHEGCGEFTVEVPRKGGSS